MPGYHNGPSPCRMVVLLGLEAHVCQGPWCAQSGCARTCLDERTAVSQVRLMSTLLAVLCAPAPYMAYSSVVITSPHFATLNPGEPRTAIVLLQSHPTYSWTLDLLPDNASEPVLRCHHFHHTFSPSQPTSSNNPDKTIAAASNTAFDIALTTHSIGPPRTQRYGPRLCMEKA